MGRSPCCSKEGLNRGAWTALEDKILTAYIKAHGEGRWRSLPKRAGLKRCGKSCRLRWLNYLRPDIKRGNISHDEEELIIRLHKLLGNRWSLIAGRLPGRTDNEIKNYWNTTLGKKTGARSCSPTSKHRPRSNSRLKHLAIESQTIEPHTSPTDIATQPQPIRTKALRCTKVLVPALPPPNYIHSINPTAQNSLELQPHQSHLINSPDSDNLKVDNGTEKLHLTNSRDSNLFNFGCDEFRASDDDADAKGDYNHNNNLCMGSDHSLPFHETCFEDWVTNCCLEDNVTLDLESLASFLDSEEWP